MTAEQVRVVGAELRELRIDQNQPSVIVVFGKSGVGKTSVANEISRRLGVKVLSSDTFRRERFPKAQYEEWHSSQAMWDMMIEARKLFNSEEESVVLDATFSKKRSRLNAAVLAKRFGKRLIWVEVVCDKGLVKNGNINGKLVEREFDEPVDVKSRIVIDNSVRTDHVQEQISGLVSLIMSR